MGKRVPNASISLIGQSGIQRNDRRALSQKGLNVKDLVPCHFQIACAVQHLTVSADLRIAIAERIALAEPVAQVARIAAQTPADDRHIVLLVLEERSG